MIGVGWTWRHWTYSGARRRRHWIWRHMNWQDHDRLIVHIDKHGRFRWIVSIEEKIAA